MINNIILLSGIGVIGGMVYFARLKGRSAVFWGFTAALTYYVPTIGFSRYVFPELVKGIADSADHETLSMIQSGITIILALLFCGVTYKILELLPNKKFTKEELKAFEEFEKYR